MSSADRRKGGVTAHTHVDMRRRRSKRKTIWIITVLSGLVLAGLLLVYGLTHSGNGPDATGGATVTSAPTGDPVATATPEPTGTATPTGEALTPAPTPAAALEGTVHVLSVGEGSSALFCSGDTVVIVDGGDSATSSYVVSYIKSLGISHIDLMIATHYDSDHISGLIGAMSAFSVDNLWGPDYEGTTKTYTSFMNMAEGRKLALYHPANGEVFRKGGITVTVLASEPSEPDSEPGESGNERSMALTVELGGCSVLVMGDSSAARERALVREGVIPVCDIFLVNHHGSRRANTAELLAAVKPKIAVISVGANDYGHPGSECIDRLIDCGADIFRTDRQGTVTLAIEEGVIRPDRDALEDPYAAPDGGEEIREADPPEGVTFLLNGNTKVYHLPTCASVRGVMRRNWSYFYGTAEEAEALGYRPCGSCLGSH